MSAETQLPTPSLPPRAASPLTCALRFGVRSYQMLLSPALHALGGPGCGCRFSPSCSHYALEALTLHGAWRGSALAARRVLRCHPWGASGHDPVPLPSRPASTS